MRHQAKVTVLGLVLNGDSDRACLCRGHYHYRQDGTDER